MNASVPEVKQLVARNVAVVSFVGDFVGKGEVFNNLIQKLCNWANPKGLLAGDVRLSAAYQNDLETTPADEMKVEVCLEVPEGIMSDDVVKIKKMPGGKYAVMNVELDSSAEYSVAWEKVFVWLKANKYEVDITRPSYEFYLNNPDEHPQKHHIIDICIGIQ